MKANLPIIYTCDQLPNKGREHFIREHALIYIQSGCLTVNDGKKTYSFKTGDFLFLQRNHLAKFSQEPDAEGEFSSVSIYFSQEMLQCASAEDHFEIEKGHDAHAVRALAAKPMLRDYLESLTSISQTPDRTDHNFLKLKAKEVLILLLESHPEFKNILFDFNVPRKKDLKTFMEHNYHFMVSLDCFAYLTGRSPAAFKRDFIYLFHINPERWIHHRRLQKAYQLIKEQGEMPVNVYQEVGFKSLTHFSFSFKRLFGDNPSSI